jgi:hydrogenase-4 membrane subunit HyfE
MIFLSAAILPLLMMMTRSHIASTSCIMCVEKNSFVLPAFFMTSRISIN